MVYRIFTSQQKCQECKKEEPTFFNLIEASEVKSKSNSFTRINIWASQLGLLKLLRSLEGGTRVQQNNNWLLLQLQFQQSKYFEAISFIKRQSSGNGHSTSEMYRAPLSGVVGYFILARWNKFSATNQSLEVKPKKCLHIFYAIWLSK